MSQHYSAKRAEIASKPAGISIANGGTDAQGDEIVDQPHRVVVAGSQREVVVATRDAQKSSSV